MTTALGEKDISSLAQARKRLFEMSAIVESSDDAIISKNLDGTIRSWNGGAERLYGFSSEKAIGDSSLAYVPDDRRAEEA